MSIDVFISHSPADGAALLALEAHLAALKRSGLIRTWNARQIGPGEEERAVTDRYIKSSGLILLLISPDFLHSEYHYDVELKHAIDRHHARTARVVPIIVQYVDWRGTLIDGLSVLPEQGRPVNSAEWGSTDKAWTNVARHLRTLVEEMLGRTLSYPSPSGKSFVEEHGGRFSMPHSAPSSRSFVEAPSSRSSAPHSRPAASYAAPSSRAPLSHSPPSSSRHSSHSQPAISVPVPPYSSRRSGSASWAATPAPAPVPWVARTPAPQQPSGRPLLKIGLLAFTTMVVAAGLWVFNRAKQQSEQSDSPFILPGGPVATLNRDPSSAATPAPGAVAGPCCGGSACEPALRDTQGSMCAKVADHCATCPSFRARIDGACRDALAPSQRFRLRLARVDLAGMSPSVARVCVRLKDGTAASRQCTSVKDASDLHHGIPGSEMDTRLPLTIADLIDPNRGLHIELEIGGRPYAASAAALLEGPLLRSALCRGISYQVDKAQIAFYLDDM